jgi:Polysaccharide lyase
MVRKATLFFSILNAGLFASAAPAQTVALADFYNPGTKAGWSQINNNGNSFNLGERSTPTRATPTSLRFEIRFATDKGNGYHNEVKRAGGARAGATKFYGMSYFVPNTWIFEPNRVIVSQFFSQYNYGLPTPGLGPTSFLHMEDGKWFFLVRFTDLSQPDKTDGVDLDLGQVTKDIYNDFVFQIKWSTSTDGFVKVWRGLKGGNLSLVKTYNGKTIFDTGATDYTWNLGVYTAGWKAKAPSSSATDYRILYVDEVRMGDTIDEAKPR